MTLTSDGADIGLTISGTTLAISDASTTPVGTYTKTITLTLKDHVGAVVRSHTESVQIEIYGCERNTINHLNLDPIVNQVTTAHSQTLLLSHSNDPSVVNLDCPVTATLVDDGNDIGVTIIGSTLAVSDISTTPVGTYTKTITMTLWDHLGAEVRSHTEEVEIEIYGCERHSINNLDLATI